MLLLLLLLRLRVCEVHLAESCDFTPTYPAPNTTLPTILQTTLASKIFKTCPKYWSTAYVLHFTNFHYQTEADIRPFTLLGPFSDSQTLFCLRTSMSLFHFAKFRLEHIHCMDACLINFKRAAREDWLRGQSTKDGMSDMSDMCCTELISCYEVLGCLDIWQRNGSQRWMPRIYSQVQRRVLRPRP